MEPFELAQGVHDDVKEADYHRLQYFSNSMLQLFRKSPAHLRWALDHPDERKDSDAFRLGHATECAIMEPDKFAEQWVIAERCAVPIASGKRKGEPCGNPGKFVSDGGGWFCGQHKKDGMSEPTGNVLTKDEHAMCLNVQRAVSQNKLAHELLFGTKGKNQLTIVWEDRTTGVPCKGRLDRLCRWRNRRTVVDLKSTQDASLWGFERSIYKFGYHTQHGMYNDGLVTLDQVKYKRDPVPADKLFIVYEKEPPYSVVVYRLDDQAIEEGRAEYTHHMNRFKYCREKQSWPSYAENNNMSMEPEYISIPRYAFKYTGDF